MTGRPGPPSTAAPEPSPDLERKLGTIDAAAVVVSNVIGSGILMVPAIVAGYAPSAPALLSAWLVGGMLAFAGAMAYAELATMRPRAGGEYVYLRAAYGPLPAFLTGWTSFIAGFAAVFVGLGAAASVISNALSDRNQRAIAGFVLVVAGLAFMGLLPGTDRLVAGGLLQGADRTSVV